MKFKIKITYTGREDFLNADDEEEAIRIANIVARHYDPTIKGIEVLDPQSNLIKRIR